MSKIDLYLDKVNEYAKKINWEKLINENYKMQVGGELVKLFNEVYGADSYISRCECEEEEGFAEIPGLIRSRVGNKEYLALLSICVQDSGEHYGTTILHPSFGFVDQENFKKKGLNDLIPYDYKTLIYVEGDIHTMYQY